MAHLMEIIFLVNKKLIQTYYVHKKSTVFLCNTYPLAIDLLQFETYIDFLTNT